MNRYQIKTELGAIALSWTSPGLLRSIAWSEAQGGPNYQPRQGELPPRIRELVVALGDYFGGGHPVERIPWEILETTGWSEFQWRVYQAVASVPHGETRTYGWVAGKVKKPQATRAVGQALRANPFPVLIPCHRVVSWNSLGGFMGQVCPDEPELKLKSRLIALEEFYLNPIFSFISGEPGAATKAEAIEPAAS